MIWIEEGMSEEGSEIYKLPDFKHLQNRHNYIVVHMVTYLSKHAEVYSRNGFKRCTVYVYYNSIKHYLHYMHILK